MGCFSSKEDAPAAQEFDAVQPKEGPRKAFQKPKWKSDEPLTASKLKKMREEFWDTQPHYGGDRVIWDTLKAACEADLATAKLVLETAGIVVAAADMTVCYDERGAKYELPKYVLSDPTNLQPDEEHA